MSGDSNFINDLGVVLRNTELDETQFKRLFREFILTFRPSPTSDPKQTPQQNPEWDEEIFDIAIEDDAPQEDANGPPFYLHLLRQTVECLALATSTTQPLGPSSPTPFFRLDLSHVQQVSSELYSSIIQRPSDCIVFMDEVLAELAQQEYADMGLDPILIKVSLFHNPYICRMRDLDPKHIESLISFRGLVIRCSSVIPEMRVAVFRCTSRKLASQTLLASEATCTISRCDHEETVALINGEIQEPLHCVKCNSKYSFELFHARCIFGNKQLLKVQETLEHIPEGETPQTVIAYVFDELVDAAKPGDFVEITGIYRASGVRVLPRMRLLKSVYRTYIDVNSITKDYLSRFLISQKDLEGEENFGVPSVFDPCITHPDATDNEHEPLEPGDDSVPQSKQNTFATFVWTQQLVDKMKQLGKNPNIYNLLVHSLAPNIFECDDVKKGLLCHLFGGTPKTIGDRSSRCDIHILLCGDPSTAKSQFLKYVHGLAPRGVYTCGRGSSAVGLTASVVRDTETKDFILESGAIVLSDRGVCCIDEFDKMDETARIILHEVMEQQTVSIAKAGIVCSLNARTAILASANPIYSRYDTRRSVVDNINLPPTLMSRFDLIYLMLDTPNPSVDRELATHLCELYAVDREKTRLHTSPLDRKTLTRYISYAREFCHPKLTQSSASYLIDTYVDIRLRGADRHGASLTATPRQLESLIRLSEALAKMELSDVVLIKHVKEAVRLMQVATYAALVDPTTGRLDFEQLSAGISGGSRARKRLLESIVVSCLKEFSTGLDRTQLANELCDKLKTHNEYPLDPMGRELSLLIRDLEESGTIARIHGGRYIYLTSV